MDKDILITNIQRMCFHDGPGIRTTVFFKGCNLRCPWCANPENISFERQNYVNEDGIVDTFGRMFSTEELKYEILKDKAFWMNGGGVTFSGGEPLLHIKKIETIIEELYVEGVHMAVETALMVPFEYWVKYIKYISLFIVDMKILTSRECENVIGGNVDLYFKNLEILRDSGVQILFRIPCCYEYTLHDDNINAIKECLVKFPQSTVEIFALHDLAKTKYKKLDKEWIEFSKVNDDDLESLKKELNKIVRYVIINKI